MATRKSSKLVIHPIAAMFPVLGEEELQELADNIARNGQIHPAVLDQEGQLIDGINRAKACEMAGVECSFETLENGIDPVEYILAANINRRHLTAGQRAMAYAMAYPEALRGGARKKGSTFATKVDGFSEARLSKARAVLKNLPEYAKEVLQGGGLSLDQAFEKTKEYGGEESNRKSRLRKLKGERPDLAEAVEEESMTLEEAETKANEEAEAKRQLRWATTTTLLSAMNLVDKDAKSVDEIIDNYDPAIAEQKGEKITKARLARAAEFWTALSTKWR